MTTILIDAHLSPAIATWIDASFDVTALALRDIGLRDAEDLEIFAAAKAQGVIFMTKDSDFVDLVDRLDAPPKIIWLTCGNTAVCASVWDKKYRALSLVGWAMPTLQSTSFLYQSVMQTAVLLMRD